VVTTLHRLGTALVALAIGASAAAIACGTFSGGDELPSDAAVDDGVVADTNADAIVPTDGAPACVRAAIEASDAGPDANCEGTGSVVDLDTAPNDCGRCRHSCRGDGCVAGRCKVVEITPFEQEPYLGDIIDGALFYSTNGDSFSQVRRIPLGPNGPTGPSTLIATISGGGPGGILSDLRNSGGVLFGLYSTRGVIVQPLDGGPHALVVDDANQVAGLDADPTNLYWRSVLGKVSLRRLGSDAGEVPLHADPKTYWVGGLVTDGTRVFWSTHPKPVDGGATPVDTIWMRGVGEGASSMTRATVTGTVFSLAVAGKYVYWGNDLGEVWRALKATNDPAELVTRLTGANRVVESLAVDDESVFAFAGPGDGSRAGEIVQAPNCGGPPRRLYEGVMSTPPLLLAGPNLYWRRDGFLVRMTK
jgi:hypothetical protein